MHRCGTGTVAGARCIGGVDIDSAGAGVSVRRGDSAPICRWLRL